MRLEDDLVRRAVNLTPEPVVDELILAVNELLMGINELLSSDAEWLLGAAILEWPLLEGLMLEKPVVNWLVVVLPALEEPT